MMPTQINGWTVAGADDIAILAAKPELFSATRGGVTLTIHSSNLVSSLTVSSPPTEETSQEQTFLGLTEWRLRRDGYDIARARSLEGLLEKTQSILERL